MAEKERRFWSHSTRETDGPWWLHGRRWWHVAGCVIGIEFLTFRRARFGGIRIKLGGQHSENVISGMIGWPRIFTLYCEVSTSRKMHRWLPTRSHVSAIEVSNLDQNPSVGVTIWKHDDGSWRRSDRWWQRRQKTIWLKPLIFGKARRTEEIVKGPVDVAVPMPEGHYPATVTITKTVSRFRLGRVLTHYGYDIEIKDNGYLPVPGKGSAAYNCGPDGIFSMSGSGRHVEDAVTDIIRSALRSRRNYGGAWDYSTPIS